MGTWGVQSQWCNRLARSTTTIGRPVSFLERTLSRRGKMPEFPPWLVPAYFLDESDPDILVLRRADGSFVAAFSASGATRDGILEAA
jgi:hypothetical protein